MSAEAKLPVVRRDPLGGWGLALAFLAPALVLMTLFKLWPIWAAADASFGTYSPGGQRIGDAGLDNYVRGFTDDRFVWGLWLQVLAGLVKVPLEVGLGLGAAMLLQAQTPGNKLGRALAVAPVFMGLPVISLVFAYIFDANTGLANTMLGTFGLPPVQWLETPVPAQVTMMLLAIWRDMGMTMLVFLAGLAAVPRDVLAAARMDGAGPWSLFITITWPMLRRSVQFAVVLATLGSFQLVVPVLILTKGGPLEATNLASYQIFEQGFVYFDFGQASAMSLVLVAALLIAIALELRWLRVKWKPA